MTTYKLHVNGKNKTIDVDSDTPLLYVLRDDLALHGPKYGCGLGQCGACTVLINGEATRSCITPLSGLKPGAKVIPWRDWVLPTRHITSSKPSSTSRRCNAAIASMAWSCSQCPSSTRTLNPVTRRSARHWPITCVAAARIRASLKQWPARPKLATTT